MQSSRYLIVGGGLAADAACRGIRELDSEGTIALIADEQHPPYARPPLSKALWKGDDESTIWRGTGELGVELRLGRRIVALDLERREARDDRGRRHAYEKLLLATGGQPRRLPFGGDDVVHYRTLDDYRRVRALAVEGARSVVVGGGFIGSEMAAALATSGCSVTIVFPDEGIGARIFPASLSTALNRYYRERGVEVVAGRSVTGVEPGLVTLDDGRTLAADAVVAGIGLEPEVGLALEAGLPVSDGIVVDGLGRVGGREDVFAAGDVARFPVPALGRDLRVEHEDHAKSHGRQVGANMAGAGEPYEHLPFFYSDLFDVGYEAVGDLDRRLETVAEVDDVHEQGVVYYLDEGGSARGVLLWNLFGRVDDARTLIRAGVRVAPGALGERIGSQA